MAKVGRERTIGFAALPTPGTYAPSIRDQFVSHRRLCRLGQCRDRLFAQLAYESRSNAIRPESHSSCRLPLLQKQGVARPPGKAMGVRKAFRALSELPCGMC